MSAEFKLEMAIAKAMGNKNYELAIDSYEKLYEIRKDTHSLNGIASCYKKLGDLDKAIEYAEKSLLVDNNNFESLKLLAMIYHKKGSHSEAYDYIVKAINIGSSITEKDIPFYLSLVLKVLQIFPRFKGAQENLIASLQYNDEWLNWAKEYKWRYENQNWSQNSNGTNVN